MASLEVIRAERLKKLDELKAAGREPYPIKTARDFSLAEVREKFTRLAARQKPCAVAGRILVIRGQGAISFADLDDGTAKLQLVLKQDELGEARLEQWRQWVDWGDLISVRGSCFTTERGELSLLVKDWTMLAKSLRPLPDKWHGLQDVEERFRQRYLDTLMSPAVKQRFITRSRLITAIRQYLDRAGFLEVETPVLQPLAGGASAQPFVTHHQSLDIDLFLRISEELYLKRLLVGGFPKIYSLSRNFRNEGIDQSHNPEFTMLEFYEAYSDATAMRQLVEKLLVSLARTISGGVQLNFQTETINFTPPFKVVSYYDLLQRYALIPDPAAARTEELYLKASQLGAKVTSADTRTKLLDAIYKRACRPKLIQPTFIVNYPADYLPLAKRLPDQPDLVDAWQLVAGGLELVKAFSELNDPLDQRARFEAQELARAAGDQEAQAKDEEFLTALEYGMPPAGGVGIGIDRLAMLFTDVANIKETILFPTLKPKEIN